MRILRFLFSSFIIIGALVVVAALLAREGLLLWGTSTVRSSLTELQAISRTATEYVRMCRQKGTPADQVAIERLQLRFVDSHEYVLEVLCTQFTLDPIVIRSQKLPPFVEKIPGSAGIIWGNDRSGVVLQTFGRQRSVYVDKREITTGSPSTSLGTSPVSSCGGFGYMCCQEETQSGVGEPYTQVNDCPKSCYHQCVVRPVLLSLATDPFPEGQNRVLTITNGTNVTFSYVASFEGKQPVKVTIDYGDGAQDELNTLTGETAHTYACTPGRECQYTVQVKVVTAQNITSADTPLTRMTIKVKP